MRKRNSDQPDEDLVLWERVTSNVKPIRSARFAGQKPQSEKSGKGDGGASSSLAKGAVKSTKPPASPKTARQTSPTKNLRTLPIPSIPVVQPVDLRAGEHAGLDKSTRRKLFRGDVPVTRQLDLHGMTAAQAQMRLGGFIQESAHNGHRCVLVVTGKGTRGDGVLRRHVPIWLKNPSLAELVLALAEARPADGGAGALYVLLRRRRGESRHNRNANL